MASVEAITEKHYDGYVTYPVGIGGLVVGEGDTHVEALADIESAIRFHVGTPGAEAFDADSPPPDVFVAEATVGA